MKNANNRRTKRKPFISFLMILLVLSLFIPNVGMTKIWAEDETEVSTSQVVESSQKAEESNQEQSTISELTENEITEESVDNLENEVIEASTDEVENTEDSTESQAEDLIEDTAVIESFELGQVSSAPLLAAASGTAIVTSSNSYYDEMSTTDKAKIGTFANYTLEGNVVYSYNNTQTDPSGKTYSLKYAHETVTTNELWYLCTNAYSYNGTWQRNTLYNCVYYGYPYNKYSTDLLQKAVNTYGISKEKAQDALRLATQLAIWFTTNKNYSVVQDTYHSSAPTDGTDPVFYLADDIINRAYQGSSYLPDIELDVYGVEGSAPYLLATRTGEMDPLEEETTSVSVPANTFEITGTVTVDGNTPGEDNIFTFGLYASNGTTLLATTTNDKDGNIVFDASNLSGTSFIVKQIPTDEEKAAHVNMVFDETADTITVTGISASEGAYWIKDGGVYSTDGGALNSENTNKLPITVYETQNRTGNSILAYCIQNKKQFPYVSNKTSNPIQNSLYTAHIASDSDIQSYSEKDMSTDEIAKLKKVVYYYSVNKPDVDLWENVEDTVGYLTGKDISYSASTMANVLNTISSITVPSGFVFVILTSNYSSQFQNIITGYMTETRQEVTVASFANATSGLSIPDNPVSTDGTLPIEKDFVMTLGAMLPEQTFTFTISPADVTDGQTVNGLTLYDGVGENQSTTISFDGFQESVEQSSNGVTFTGLKGNRTFSFANSAYTNEGVYRYEVKETAGTTEGITYDTKAYTVDVYVIKNENGGLEAKYVTVKDSQGNDSSVVFTNTVETKDVGFTKVVKGSGADPDQKFGFYVQITDPENRFGYASIIPATTYNADGTSTTTQIYVGKSTYIYLTAGQTYQINLPVGMQLTASEDADSATGYSVKLTSPDNTEDADQQIVHTVSAVDNNPVYTFTNTKEDIVPTGVNDSSLSFTMMLIAAMAGFGLMIFTRKMNSD